VFEEAAQGLVEHEPLDKLILKIRGICNHPETLFDCRQICLTEWRQCAAYVPGNPEDEGISAMMHTSGKMILLDKLLDRLELQNKQVHIVAQLGQVLNLIEEYVQYKNYRYERLNGSCDAFQKPLPRFLHDAVTFVFLSDSLDAVALTPADTLVVYDWDGPIKAGYRVKVIFRLATRGTVEDSILRDVHEMLRRTAFTAFRGTDEGFETFRDSSIDELLSPEPHTETDCDDQVTWAELLPAQLGQPETESFDIQEIREGLETVLEFGSLNSVFRNDSLARVIEVLYLHLNGKLSIESFNEVMRECDSVEVLRRSERCDRLFSVVTWLSGESFTFESDLVASMKTSPGWMPVHD